MSKHPVLVKRVPILPFTFAGAVIGFFAVAIVYLSWITAPDHGISDLIQISIGSGVLGAVTFSIVMAVYNLFLFLMGGLEVEIEGESNSGHVE